MAVGRIIECFEWLEQLAKTHNAYSPYQLILLQYNDMLVTLFFTKKVFMDQFWCNSFGSLFFLVIGKIWHGNFEINKSIQVLILTLIF